MILIAGKYINPAAVDVIEPINKDRCNVLIRGGEWIALEESARVVESAMHWGGKRP